MFVGHLVCGSLASGALGIRDRQGAVAPPSLETCIALRCAAPRRAARRSRIKETLATENEIEIVKLASGAWVGRGHVPEQQMVMRGHMGALKHRPACVGGSRWLGQGVDTKCGAFLK